jgi:branched-chain amino acid transport system permease protein
MTEATAITEAIVTGILLGGLYAVIALGLNLIFGIIRVINFAHGSIMVIFMYLGFFLWYLLGIDPYVGMLIVVPIAFGFGYGVQHVLIRPMFVREKSYVVEPLGVLLLMAGLDMVISNSALQAFGARVWYVYGSAFMGTVHVGFLSMSKQRLIVVLVVVLLTVGVHWLLNHTNLGNRIRAVGQNREAAAICGINVHHIYALTFGLGCAVTAIGGCAALPFMPITPFAGMGLALRAFVVVILGGLGSIRGALLAGIIIGVVEMVGAHFTNSSIGSIIVFAIFLVIIVSRPKGLMGTIEV